jgi:hypothetical protein
MLFTIDVAGDFVGGWLVTDNPAATPVLTVVLKSGRERRALKSDLFRPDLKNAGLHSTGLCGFVLDQETCPGFEPGQPIEVYDAASNLLMYRFAAGADAPVRLFHLETQTFPVYPVARHLSPLVQLVYADADMIAEETLANLLYLPWTSVLVSGAILLRNYEGPLEAGAYDRVVLLCDPLRELAGRLIRAKALAAEETDAATWRRLGQGALIETVADVDLTDAAALARALRRMPDEDFFALGNPTLRKLVAKLPNAPLDKHHVGSGLDSLAGFAVVGFEDEFERFVEDLEALVGRDSLPRERLPGPPELAPVMEALRSCRPAEELLQLDEALYALARGAFEKARVDDPMEAA